MARFQALIPLLVVTSYFVGALAIFHVRASAGRDLTDPEVASRPASVLLGRYLRNYIMWVLAPYERLLARLGVSPNAVTMASLAAAAGAAACLATGHFAAGGWLYLVTGMLDILDGRVARRTGRVTTSGAYFDSVIDRYAELLVFGGLAFYYRASWVLGVVLVAAIGSLMVSYSRARGEALGVDVKIGTMQRPERLFYLGFLLAHSPIWEAVRPTAGTLPLYPPAVLGLALLGLSANVTAVRRIRHTMHVLDGLQASSAASVGADAPDAAANEPVSGPVPATVPSTVAVRPARWLPSGVERLLARMRPVG
jgi:phosphatidylglycerophosphate synthase